jgi:hypothetical protein
MNRDISTKIMNGFLLDDYLYANLGFEKGTYEPIAKQTTIETTTMTATGPITGTAIETAIKEVYKWFVDGGRFEDLPPATIPYLRSNNHFHNPLKPLEQAGYSYLSGKSAIAWSQSPKGTQTPGGYYSWNDVRDYFYSALIGTDKNARNTNFAETFRGVGQLMHLAQDMSVPEHARNDGHVAYAYEEWVRDSPSSLLDYALGSPIFFPMTGLTQLESAFASAPVPIANLFDTKQYSGSNPDVTLSAIIGLSEYTNANFISSGTLFNGDFPKMSIVIIDPNTYKVDDHLNPGQKIDRQYYKKIGDGDSGYLLSGVPFMKFQADRISSYNPNDTIHITKAIPIMDDNVYQLYAVKLLPRAVGYSAGLLNYFFRGSLEISAPSTTVYAITDGKETPYDNKHQQFTKIKAKVKNTTPNETISAGTLQAVASYKIIPNYASDLSNYPPDGTVMIGDGTTSNPGVHYTYSVSETVPSTSLASGTAEDFTFDFTNHPIPAGITDLTLQVVFKGTIGNEQDNAIAVGMMDLMEPTHLVFWNLTDRFSLQYPGQHYTDNNHHLYTFDELLGFQDLVNFSSILDDLDETGVNKLNDEPLLQPETFTYNIAFAGTEPQELLSPVATVQLAAGQHTRLIVLVDSWWTFVQVAWPDASEPTGINRLTKYFQGVWNESWNGSFEMLTESNSFRHGPAPDGVTPIKQHFYKGILACYPGNTAGECPYTESESPAVDLEPVAATINFN